MTALEGLPVRDEVELEGDGDGDPEVDWRPEDADGSGELETLRDEFVEAFNARDLDALIAVAHPDVECPNTGDSGRAALAQQAVTIWDRSPGVLVTRARLDGRSCAVAWLPDEEGCWSRAALVCLDVEDALIRVVDLPEDADALDRAEADDPTGEELDEGISWSEWDSGEEPPTPIRH